jgi:hypothetical protein
LNSNCYKGLLTLKDQNHIDRDGWCGFLMLCGESLGGKLDRLLVYFNIFVATLLNEE